MRHREAGVDQSVDQSVDRGVDQSEDRGVVTPIEMMYLLAFAVVAVAMLGYLGHLHAAGVQVNNAAQLAARSASLARSSGAGIAAAQSAVDRSSFAARCTHRPTTMVDWTPSPAGTWQGGTVRVRVSCTLANNTIAGWWMPGQRTITMTDSQPIDRYQR